MYSILNLIEKSTEYLNSKGVESPRLNAELLLADILNCSRMQLYLKYDQPLNEKEVNDYRNFIARRGKREPLQYILGKVEFYGLNFLVNPDVLIPRQETEILVETVISEMGKEEIHNILDIGTGSGNIAIALTINLPNSEIMTIDKSEKAVEVAKKNAEMNNVAERIKIHCIDIKDFETQNNIKFDAIVSNPPYIMLQEYSDLDKELSFEPKSALTDFKDGLSFYETISEKSEKLLKKNGKLFFEVGIHQSEKVENILIHNGFSNIKKVKDLLGIERVVFGEFK